VNIRALPVALLLTVTTCALAQQPTPDPALPSEDGSLLCTGSAYHDKVVGKTTLLLDIDETGATRNVRVVAPLRKDLDEESVKTARLMHFIPATKKGGIPTAITVTMDVNFDCREKPLTMESGIKPPKAIGVPHKSPALSPAQLDQILHSTALDVIVNSDGSVGAARVTGSCGDKDLDGKALAAVRQSKFTPAMKRGRPVKVLLKMMIDFRPK
jgi:TonB family protein